MLSGGQVAGLIVAMFWAILVCFLAVVLLRLARLLGETTKMIADIGEHAGPLLDDMTKTVEQAGEQLDRVDTITRNMAGVTQNVSAVSTVVTSVVGNPLVKAAAFSYGVRRALGVRQQEGVRQEGVRQQGVRRQGVRRQQNGRGGQVANGRVVTAPPAKTGSRRGGRSSKTGDPGKSGNTGNTGRSGAGRK